MSTELPKGHTELSKDPRPIQAIYWPMEGAGGYRVGDASGATRIEAYDENGQMAAVPWVAVFKGDDLICRVPADQVSVHYDKPATMPF
jgi:hypothetical protein